MRCRLGVQRASAGRRLRAGACGPVPAVLRGLRLACAAAGACSAQRPALWACSCICQRMCSLSSSNAAAGLLFCGCVSALNLIFLNLTFEASSFFFESVV